MALHHGLGERVAELRQRLEEIDRISRPAPAATPEKLRELRRDLQYLDGQGAHLDARMAQLCPELMAALGIGPLPRQLAWRTRRLLLKGRELLQGLRQLGEHLDWEATRIGHPLGDQFRSTLAQAEVTLRAVQSFPESTAEQLRLCDGLEAALATVDVRVATLRRAIRRQRLHEERIRLLEHAYAGLLQGRPVRQRPLRELAESLLAEARHGEPLAWPSTCPSSPERRTAMHGLLVAQVIAQVNVGVSVSHDVGEEQVEVVLTGLVFDVGMAAMPAELLNQRGPLNAEQRRMMESHVGLSAEAVERLIPNVPELADIVRSHHERADGSGYPTGRPSPLSVRLLAVCDTYAALGSPRPHREALSPRAALAQALREAERGRLDLGCAEMLLRLAFYPVGTGVELSDGQVGIVVATHPLESGVSAAGRPVIQVLVDSEGAAVPQPTHLDLARDTTRHVARVLNENELHEWLGRS